MSISTIKYLVLTGLIFVLSTLVYGQDVEHDIVELVSVVNGEAHYEFQSDYVPYITGPSANIVGGNIQIRHLGGVFYVLDFYSSGSILPDGWVSDFVFYPFGNSQDYSVQRLRMKVQESVIKTNDDFFRMVKNQESTVLDLISNDEASHSGLKVKAITIINNADVDVHHQSGEVTFTPKTDFEGIARLQYLACDDIGTCELGLASVLIFDPEVNNVKDTVEVTSVNGELIQFPLPYFGFQFARIPTNAQSAWIGDGILNYKANAGFIGKDTMTVQDGPFFFRTLIVNVIEVPMGNGFIHQDVFYPIPNYELTFDVYQNDFYNILSIDNYTLPEIGTLTHNDLGSFTYMPPTDFVGHTSFEYTVCNGSICETAKVYLFVGKQEPRKDIDYHFVTASHVPLVIDFENDLDPSQYTITILSEPQNGTAGIFPIFLDPCETFNILKGYLIYEHTAPQPLGDDYFTVSYCLNEVDICDTITIRVTVEQDLGASCSCTEDCVWPGDSNNDGYVDISDLLMVGYHIGEQGVERELTQNNWEGYKVGNWEQQESITLDGKYADTDGDGLVSQRDTSAIIDNYQKVRSLVANRDHVLEAIPFELYNDQYNEDIQLDSGDLVTFDILLGTYDLPALEILGVSFSIDIVDYPVDQNSVTVSFDDNGWLVNGSPKLDLDILTDTSRIDAGITRLDRSSASGYGQVGRLDFIIVDDLDGIRDNGETRSLTVKLTNGTAVTASGNSIALPDTERTIKWKRQVGNPPLTNKSLLIYPNPTSDLVNIHLNGVNSMESYQIYTMSGQRVASGGLDGKKGTVEVHSLNPGLYIIQVMTNKGPIAKKIEVVR